MLSSILAQSQENNRALAHLCVNTDGYDCPNAAGTVVPSMAVTMLALVLVTVFLSMR